MITEAYTPVFRLIDQLFRKKIKETQQGGDGCRCKENAENQQDEPDFFFFLSDRFGNSLFFKKGKFIRIIWIIANLHHVSPCSGNILRVAVAEG